MTNEDPYVCKFCIECQKNLNNMGLKKFRV
jgi:hypothetical protein